jgi:hypothetical protein
LFGEDGDKAFLRDFGAFFIYQFQDYGTDTVELSGDQVSSLKDDIRLFTTTTTIKEKSVSSTTIEEEVPNLLKAKKRKRKKNSAYEPNAKEVAAGARHEASFFSCMDLFFLLFL